ncbi:MAG: radical SAM protein [Minisyncoccia bacterium]|jgi:organic radical activating enzyme
MPYKNLSDLTKGIYLLPWNRSDNPNGWVEPSTFCQLKCPGCYRALNKDGAVRVHEDLSDMKKQIDMFVKTRNVQTISISGGEPLLYPKLKELLSYIKLKGLKTKIFTNGIALDEKNLRELKNHGANEFIIHIDKSQGRQGYHNENELNKLRRYYCDLFRKIGGVNLSFIMPISKETLSDIKPVLSFCRENADIVGLIVFTLYSDVVWNESEKKNINTDLAILDIVNQIQENFKFKPCAYLGSTENLAYPSWLFSMSIGLKDKILGFFDGRVYKAIQEKHHSQHGTYLYTKINKPILARQLIKLLGFSSIRRILANYSKNVIINPKKREKLYMQTLLILRGPKFASDGSRNLCAGCPDAMYYNGKLVPSCILEEVKQGEHKNTEFTL